MSERSVVLLSGGLDSMVAALNAIEKGLEPIGLTIDYGQKARQELQAAKDVARLLKIQQQEIQIDVSKILPSPITGFDVVDQLSDPNQSPYYVPGRNTIFLSIALGIAESRNLSAIVVGANLDDQMAFRDCRPIYFEMFEKVAMFGAGRRITIEAPLAKMRKADVIHIAADRPAAMRATFTCYSPVSDLHCGTCPACVIRRRGFIEAGVSDFTDYAG